jgi:N-acetylmuramic acid 6-phosphate (MurNAc-6-P) etherase
MAKQVAVSTVLEVIDEAIQIHGGYGYVDSDLERYYRDARLYKIGAGTGGILKIAIARELYREIGLRCKVYKFSLLLFFDFIAITSPKLTRTKYKN